MKEQDPKPSYLYDAFISYNASDRDFAEKLEKILENYTPPKELDIPHRRLNIFRFQTDMTGTEYYSAIEKRLKNSAKLIIICSPNARKSEYVNDEIKRFVNINDPHNIIPILIDGIPNNEAGENDEDNKAFPESLCKVLEMPLAVNYIGINLKKEKINKGVYDNSWFTLLSNVYGLNREDIEQRDKRRRLKRQRLITIGVSALIIALSALTTDAMIQRNRAEESEIMAQDSTRSAQKQRIIAQDSSRAAQEQRIIAQDSTRVAQEQRDLAKQNMLEAKTQSKKALGRLLSIQSEQVREQELGSSQLSLLLAIESVNKFPSWETDRSLRKSVAGIPRLYKDYVLSAGRKLSQFSDSGRYLIVYNKDSVKVLEVMTGMMVFSIDGLNNIQSARFFANEQYIFIKSDIGKRNVYKFPEGHELHDFKIQTDYNSEFRGTNAADFVDPKGNLYAQIRKDTLIVFDLCDVQEKFRTVLPEFSNARRNTIIFSPDNQYLMSNNTSTFCCWDLLADWKLRGLYRKGIIEMFKEALGDDWNGDPWFEGFAFSNDSKLIGFIYNNMVLIYNIKDGTLFKFIDNPKFVTLINKIHFLPGDRHMVICSLSGSHIRNIENGEIVKELSIDKHINEITTNKKGNCTILEGSEITSIISNDNFQEISQLTNYDQIETSGNGRFITSLDGDKLRIWLISGFQDKESIFDMSFDNIQVFKEKPYVALANGKTASIIDWNSSKELFKFEHDKQIIGMNLVNNDSILICISRSGADIFYNIWDIFSEKLLTKYTHKIHSVYDAIGHFVIHSDKKYISIINKEDLSIIIWDVIKNKVETKTPAPHLNLSIFGISEDRDFAFVEDQQTFEVVIMKLPELDVFKKFKYQNDKFNNYGRHNIKVNSKRELAFHTYDRTLKVFEYPSWKEIDEYNLKNPIDEPFYSDLHNKVIYTYYNSKISKYTEIIVFDLIKGKIINSIKTNTSIVDLFLSKQENFLITTHKNGNIKKWNFPACTLAGTIKTGLDFDSFPNKKYLSFNDDNDYILVVDNNNFIRVYCSLTYKLLKTIQLETSILDFGFLPDNKYIYTSGYQGANIFLWRNDDLLDKAKDHLIRNFSAEEWSKFIIGEYYRKTVDDLPSNKMKH